jgi:hypothetical protein
MELLDGVEWGYSGFDENDDMIMSSDSSKPSKLPAAYEL